MSRAETKAKRLLQIETLLLTHPQGLTCSEIARRLSVNRSTILRNLVDLDAPVYTEGSRLFIDREAYLINVRFSLHEATALHLATRLLATRMDRQNPHAASALRKLGLALETLAPRVSAHLQDSADQMDDASRREDPNFLRTLEVLTLAWAQLRQVKIWHQSDSPPAREYIFAPYFIEPYAVGQAVHVIGLSHPPDELRTFKLERIQRIELLHESYTIPTTFDPYQLLADAWGIWYTGVDPVLVALHFFPRAARRVRESCWHRSEQIEELPDGSLIWRAHIAEPQEMLPWIRGWGADVEVLEPPALRAKIEDEVKRMAHLYQKDGTKG